MHVYTYKYDFFFNFSMVDWIQNNISLQGEMIIELHFLIGEKAVYYNRTIIPIYSPATSKLRSFTRSNMSRKIYTNLNCNVIRTSIS